MILRGEPETFSLPKPALSALHHTRYPQKYGGLPVSALPMLAAPLMIELQSEGC